MYPKIPRWIMSIHRPTPLHADLRRGTSRVHPPQLQTPSPPLPHLTPSPQRPTPLPLKKNSPHSESVVTPKHSFPFNFLLSLRVTWNPAKIPLARFQNRFFPVSGQTRCATSA